MIVPSHLSFCDCESGECDVMQPRDMVRENDGCESGVCNVVQPRDEVGKEW